MKTVFSTALLPPLAYFKALQEAEDPWLDLGEHYIKQTFRNRTYIVTSNGLMPLTIPVAKPTQPKIPVKEILISYQEPWPQNLWKSIVAAYANAPYFDELAPPLEALFFSREPLLYQWNEKLNQWALNVCKSGNINYAKSLSYIEGKNILDYRNITWYEQPFLREYPQVFRHKTGFVKGAGLLDMVFNLGPEIIYWLETPE